MIYLRRRLLYPVANPDTNLTPANITVSTASQLTSALAAVPSNVGATYIIDVAPGLYGDFNVGQNYSKGTTRVKVRGQFWNNLPVFGAFHAVGAQRLDLDRINIVPTYRDRFNFPAGNSLTSVSVRFDNAVNCLIKDCLFKHCFIALDVRNTTDTIVDHCSFLGWGNDAIRCYTNTNGEIRGLRLRNLYGNAASDEAVFPAFDPLHTGYSTSPYWGCDVRRSDQYGYSTTANVADKDGILVEVTAAEKNQRHNDFAQWNGYATDNAIEDCDIVLFNGQAQGFLINNDPSVSPSDISSGVVVRRTRLQCSFPNAFYFRRCDATCGIEDSILRPIYPKTWALNTPSGSSAGFMNPAISTVQNTTGDIFIRNCVHPATVNTSHYVAANATVTNLVASDTAVPTGWDDFAVAKGNVGQFGEYYSSL